tara:strand:- start:226 stop:384 length:159 start_codon:yes stop_codon:yes gene_type:complete
VEEADVVFFFGVVLDMDKDGLVFMMLGLSLSTVFSFNSTYPALQKQADHPIR